MRKETNKRLIWVRTRTVLSYDTINKLGFHRVYEEVGRSGDGVPIGENGDAGDTWNKSKNGKSIPANSWFSKTA